MKIETRKELESLPSTVHGGQGWKLDGVEDYSQNLNPFGPPEDLPSILAECAKDTGHYPDADCTSVREAIARHYGLGPENVAMGAGSSEIIRNFPQVFIRPGESVLIPAPSFAEYTQQCRIAGVQVDNIELRAENNFYLDRDELFSKLESKHYAALYICNPNNPTGRVEKRSKIIDIVRRCEELGTMVFLDETLLSLVADESLISLSGIVREFSNLIVAHSFTKSFAIPGMRVGFALANESIIKEMDKVRLPWNVGTLEQSAAEHLVGCEMSYVVEAANTMRRESEVMHSELEALGFPVGPLSDSFFYFVPVRELGMNGAAFQREMLREGIMVRDCASFGPAYTDYVRFCVKDPARNRKFVEAVNRVLKSMSH